MLAVRDNRGEPTGTGEGPALKPLASRQEPISSLGQPAITQTHLQPFTHTHTHKHTLTQVKEGY